MKREILAAGFAALGVFALSAAALGDTPSGESAVRAAFGNTIVETYPDGRKAEIWLKADGTYAGEGRKHDASDGHWTVKSDQLCFHQAHPFAFGATYCTPIPKVGLGQPWQAKAFSGEAITVKVEHGHVTPS